MSDRNSLEVAEFLESLARNWFIRNSLMFAAFGGVFGGIFTGAIFIQGVRGSGLVGWAFASVSLSVFGVSVFLAGVHYVVERMHRKLLGRSFDYLCDPQEYAGSGT